MLALSAQVILPDAGICRIYRKSKALMSLLSAIEPLRPGLNILTLGMWAEILHRWLGYAQRVTALAKVHIAQRRPPDSDDWASIELPDNVGVIAEMIDGALAVLHFSGVTRFAGNNRCEIYGAQIGEADLNPLAIPQELQDGRTVEEDFITAIRYNTPVSPSFFAGLKYMEFTEAVMRSVHEKCAVDLPLN